MPNQDIFAVVLIEYQHVVFKLIIPSGFPFDKVQTFFRISSMIAFVMTNLCSD